MGNPLLEFPNENRIFGLVRVMSNSSNKQVIANTIMRKNRARDTNQLSVILAVAFFATVVVGITGFSA